MMTVLLRLAGLAVVVVVASLALLAPPCSAADSAETIINVWPQPVTQTCTGQSPRKLWQSFSITSTQDSLSPIIARYTRIIADIVTDKDAWAPKKSANSINGMVISVSQPAIPDREPSAESYTIATNDNTIAVHTPSIAGAVYALETFTQILMEGQGAVPCDNLEVRDSPTLANRGLVVDVASRYLDLQTMHELIDSMAMLKLNTLGMHFSDYGAFRVATRYNELTDDLNGLYPGHVMSNLQEYASQRGVRLVPHMELPSHASGFQPAEDNVFFCTSDDVYTEKSVLNNDASTLSFLGDVITDVLTHFDTPYFFVGGADAAAAAGNCTVADVKRVFLSAVSSVTKPGTKAAVWDMAAAALTKQLPKDTLVFATPGSKPVATAGSTIVSGYRNVNASMPSLPFAGEGASQDSYRDYTAMGPSVTGAAATFFTNAMCEEQPCGSNSTITPPASFLAPRTQDRPARNATLSSLFPRVTYMAGAAWNFRNITATDLRQRVYNFNAFMALRGAQVCPNSCECTLEHYCKDKYEHYDAEIKLFEAGFIFGTVLATTAAASVIFLQIRRFTSAR
ncbi:hypothetical protein PTSG_11616 [Salpingoeca rosetta]|uniref:beta-N-acetylhexosaminidase n=1 Tax=Salpingoeca rosetta (strain ATCC 50818 / BSB-021) TaxID=946362 RepID=F2TWX8_SALR5|nr:uncharacterized protein PTSG_11616 [Salpingoeca rosetta]EGD75887.1 hypothetical protein PTSG_11616 [Salpingoeca rosetta]|eukprot:XP_004998063.1 hypothetical protein PTSG_11616 [Salpingoeca rosetta]